MRGKIISLNNSSKATRKQNLIKQVKCNYLLLTAVVLISSAYSRCISKCPALPRGRKTNPVALCRGRKHYLFGPRCRDSITSGGWFQLVTLQTGTVSWDLLGKGLSLLHGGRYPCWWRSLPDLGWGFWFLFLFSPLRTSCACSFSPFVIFTLFGRTQPLFL